jgi:primosomal protein N' (replication factor Y) (superfamily II helicase)
MYYAVALALPRTMPFTYSFDGEIQTGSRVLVPLGRRIVTGTIVEGGVPSRDDAREIIEVLDVQPAFSETMLRFTKWVSDYYLCSWGETLEAALPTGLTPSSVFYARLLRDVTDDELDAMEARAPKRAELLSVLRENVGPLRLDHLQKLLSSQSIGHQLDVLQDTGVIEIVTEMEKERGPRTIRCVQFNADQAADDGALKDVFDELDRRAPKQSLALGHLYIAHRNSEPPIAVRSLCSLLGISASVVDALVEKGLAVSTDVPAVADDIPFDVSLARTDEHALDLTPEQRKVIDAILPEIDREHAEAPYQSRVHVLQGVTGSGKTVVYQRLIAAVLEKGQTALILVPEIALTPQLHDRFRRVFGSTVALLHSNMTVGERIHTWRRIGNGELTIVIGARSGVFAPLKNVGIIIVDEEHEPSYKQDDPAPRYHGRDAAIVRASFERCPIILGSATPALETQYNVSQGRYQMHRLTHRADEAEMPSISFVDLRVERKKGSLTGTISEPLADAIREHVGRKEGVILFLNRRGYASSLQCEDCGTAPQCPNCDVSMTWHKATSSLRCHYCGHHEPRVTACSTCGSLDVGEVGTGTQRVEEDVREILTDTGAVIERMDTDTMRRRGSHRRLMQRFYDGDVDLIVGTQMITKGLDIPRVTLIGVINADQSLFQSDFRAAERTAQLLTQVAGRAGRHRSHPGRVIVQTSSPEHPAIVASYDDFLQLELEQRIEAGYPPSTRFHVIEISGRNDQDVEHVSRVLDRLLPAEHPCMVRFRPTVPPIARIRNRYRRIIVMKNVRSVDPNGSQFRSILVAALQAYNETHAVSSVRVKVDIDASGLV